MPKLAWEVALTAGDGTGNTNLLRRALWLDALGQQLHCHLPPIMASHCQLANVDGHRLVFLVDSPLWHAKLRLASQQIIGAAQKIGLQVSQVIIKTAKPAPPSPSNSRSTTGLASETTQEGLRQVLACFADESSNPQRTGSQPSSPRKIKR